MRLWTASIVIAACIITIVWPTWWSGAICGLIVYEGYEVFRDEHRRQHGKQV